MSLLEEWRPVPGHPGYEVSDIGRVVSRRRGSRRLMAGTINAQGYRYVTVRGDGAQRRRMVHQLVIEAFCGPRGDGQVVRHLDGDSLNNVATNLAYGSRSENTLDAISHGTHVTTARTHCPQGHPYSPENTYVKPPGWRVCRTCRRAESLARYHRGELTRRSVPQSTHCKRGHLLQGDNIYIRRDGGWTCHPCSLASSARWNAKRSAERAAKRAAA